MPKGEHFKKPNPRIHQVSFKLNATELAEMKRIVSDSGKSLPQFLRDIIFNSESVDLKPTVKEEVVHDTVEKVDVPEPVKEVIKKTVEKPKKEEPKYEPRKDNNNQFSLF